MNEAEAIGALAQSNLAISQQSQASLMVLGGMITHAILVGACIIGLAILLHAIINGLLVRGKVMRQELHS